MKTLIIALINQFGYLGIFLLIAIENIFPPIPSELILTFGGYVTTISHLNLWLVVVFSTLGSLLGAVILYWIGRLISPQRLNAIVASEIGQRLRLKAKHIDLSQSWFKKHGYKTVFFCRFVPILRSLISIPAGSQKMNFPIFLTLTTIGTAIWNFVLVYLGRLAGASWEKIAQFVDLYGSVIGVVIALVAVIFSLYYYRKNWSKTL